MWETSIRCLLDGEKLAEMMIDHDVGVSRESTHIVDKLN